MKVALVAFNNIFISPYINPYADLVCSSGAECHLIYPDRLGIDEEFCGTKHVVKWNKAKNKAFNFISFVREAGRILKKEKFDFVFVLTTFPAVLLSGVLAKRYKGRYAVDIRDYTYEGNKLFYHFEKKTIKNARFAVISSPGFKNFLPEGNYYMCHNVSKAYKAPMHGFERANGKIIIGYVGAVAYADYVRPTIDLVKADDRFEFHVYGRETNPAEPVKQHVEASGCDRIKYFGAYKPQEKAEILAKTDVLFNVYGNDRMLVKYALSNKLYDGFYFKKPILVSAGTAMAEEAGEYSFALDPKTATDLNALHDWYMAIDGEAFNKYANDYLDKVNTENALFEQAVIDAING